MVKKFIAIATAAATLAGCTSAGSMATTELQKRGFTDVTVVQQNATIATAWAGAPDTLCRFKFEIEVGGDKAGNITLIQLSSTGDAKKDLRIPGPNVPMLRSEANWPQIAQCWDPAVKPKG